MFCGFSLDVVWNSNLQQLKKDVQWAIQTVMHQTGQILLLVKRRLKNESSKLFSNLCLQAVTEIEKSSETTTKLSANVIR